jgi:hypothetical protein
LQLLVHSYLLPALAIKAGFRKDYKPKCLSMWNPGGLGVQNIDCKEEGAIAMAKYLQALGLSAYSASRLD